MSAIGLGLDWHEREVMAVDEIRFGGAREAHRPPHQQRAAGNASVYDGEDEVALERRSSLLMDVSRL